jgi:hypothetical protein
MHRTRPPDLLSLALLDDPHTTTTTQPSSTSLQHGSSIFDSPHASTSFNLHPMAIGTFIRQMITRSTHKPHMLNLGPMPQKPRRRLHKVKVRSRRNSARSNNIPRPQLRSLKDEFEDGGVGCHGAYESEFVVDFAVFLLFEEWPVYYDVEFVGAGCEGHACFLEFVVCVLGALVEADDAGD